MKDRSIDVLMITYNRPGYTRLALERLLETCDDDVRVWLWHNGDHEETLELVRGYRNHGQVYRFHHSRENKKLREPTNWFWQNSSGAYVSKVDDDCLMPGGWPERMREAHEVEARFGILGCFRFRKEDYDEVVARPKIYEYAGGIRILRNCWIEGSGYVMKRDCVVQVGGIRPDDSFTTHGIRLAARGWIHGWPMPFLYQDHMDDPRSEHSMLRSDADLQRWLPLSAKANGISSLVEWQDQLKATAKNVLTSPLDPSYYLGWRAKVRHARYRIEGLVSGKRRLYR